MARRTAAPAVNAGAHVTVLSDDGYIEALEELALRNDKTWSEAEDAALRRYYGRVGLRTIGKALSKSERQCRQRAQFLQIYRART